MRPEPLEQIVQGLKVVPEQGGEDREQLTGVEEEESDQQGVEGVAELWPEMGMPSLFVFVPTQECQKHIKIQIVFHCLRDL